MKNVMEFMRWAMSHASPDRIPAGSTLCVPLSEVGIDGKWEYLYGTTGRKCTQSLLDAKYEQYYKGWGWSRSEYAAATAGWVERGVTVCDCQGLEDHFSGSDTNAKGNYSKYCEDKGKIKDISRSYVFGEALFVGSSASSISHVGWIAGFAPDGEPLILHERGLSHGCVVERMSKSGKDWAWRGIMSKRYEYGNESEPTPETMPEPIPETKGTVLTITTPLMRGEEIAWLQKALNDMGYPCGSPDGICGEKTMAGVQAFSLAHLPAFVAAQVMVEDKTYSGRLEG